MSDSATWVAVGLAIGAAILPSLRPSSSWWLSCGGAGAPPPRSSSSFETHSSEPKDSTETSRSPSRRRAPRRTGPASSVRSAPPSILDAVLTRTLEATGALTSVDAGLIRLPGPNGGDPLFATLGMTTDEAARQPVAGPPGGQPARAVRIGYTYTHEEIRDESDLIRGGVSIPLRDSEGEPIGTLAVFWRGEEREATDAELAALEELASRTGPAIENGRRFCEARQLADLDALTTLHNRRYFHETLVRECALAHRYDRQLALVVFDIDDFKAINDRIGHLAGDSVLAGVAERLQSVVRSADIACRVGGDEFAVILPESALPDAEQLYSRVQFAVSSRPIGPFERLHLSAGIAQLRQDDDATSLFERADEALYRAKEAGKGQFMAADGLG